MTIAPLISDKINRRKPLLFDNELDHKLLSTIVFLCQVGAGNNNRHAVNGILIGQVQYIEERFGKYINFNITRSWESF